MIVILSGGTFTPSLNKSLAKIAQNYFVEAQFESILIDPADYKIPLLIPGKMEENPPEDLLKVRGYFEKAQGFFITTPEYNGNISPVLLNLLDSVLNFAYFAKAPVAPVQNKPVLIASASPSIYGALKANSILNGMFHHMGSWVLPNSMAFSNAATHIVHEPKAEIRDETLNKRFKQSLQQLVDACKNTCK